MSKESVIIFILSLIMMACQHFIPKARFALDDLAGIKVYNLLVECDDIKKNNALDSFTTCDGGIKDGMFYCHNVIDFDCQPGEAILLTGFDSESFPKIDSYIQYLTERFKNE